METPKGKKATASNTTKNVAHGLRDLFAVGLQDIYYAEKTLSKTLPNMAKNASTPQLATSITNHLKDTNEQISRLEKIFEVTGIKPTAKKSTAMEGILKENNDIINKTDQGIVRDACLIAAEQKIKHYAIASYGTLHAYAKTIGEVKAASLLALNLDEEKKADAVLTKLAMDSINNKSFTADAITKTRI
jgi:ferritin-like metal-binding protein YciE